MRIPKSEAEKRATKAARQKRFRDRQKAKATAAQVVDHVMSGDTPMPSLAGIPDKDLAILMRDRVYAIVAEMSDSSLLTKDFAPALNLGLKAQSQLDQRAKVQAKQGNAQLAFSIIAMLTGAPVRQLSEGTVVEGKFEPVDEAD